MSAEAASAICTICPHHCNLRPGALGVCKGRRNVGGEAVCDNYGKITSLALDPIEKKPLAEFRPGTTVLSLGSYGCNLHCPWCQNASIAAAGPKDVGYATYEPAEIVQMALDRAAQGCIGIAYTYNEPLISFEFVCDTAKLAHEAGLANVLVSNGMICGEPLQQIAPLIDAANIDLKGWTQHLYDLVGGKLETVKRTIEVLHESGCHVEVTTLIVPGENDSLAEIEAIASWIASIDTTIPYHLTRFFPCYKMADKDPTSVATVLNAVEVARRHLVSVYAGNI